MKKLFVLASVLLALSGCASQEYAQYSKAQSDIATARHNSDVARYKAMADIAATGDASAKVAAVMAIALGQQAGTVNSTLQAPPANQALQWASILVPGITQVAGMRYSYLSQQTSSNNATALGISTNNTFTGIAGRIQAPGSITTTTNTLSGVGTLGSGAYSTTDNHTVTPAPIVTPVVEVTPIVVPPVVQVTPIVQMTTLP